ncbi:MAG: hypothetical protein IPL55_04755 [Saprospiraceae bacterium]|jgi:hypothetical protein|nr:hypothetical protein [Saprospiraceae bacterium]MBL0027442.1 hypothetical protein [Saprospiraceae bacterium]
MIRSLFIAFVIIVGLMIFWVMIQSWWRNTFHEYTSDDDVLAGRSSCTNCGCTTACKKNKEKLIRE